MNVTLDRLHEIETERQQTMNDAGFQKWVKELNISLLVRDKEPIHRAKEMMSNYDYSKYVFRAR